MKVDCSLEERTSQKGNNYKCLVIKLTPTYEKIVFLDKAEIELLQAQGNNKAVSDFDKMFGKK